MGPNSTRRFTVPAGTKCAVRSIYEGDWTTHTTTRVNHFDRFDRWVKDETGDYYEFRADGGWVMLVQARFVLEWGK